MGQREDRELLRDLASIVMELTPPELREGLQRKIDALDRYTVCLYFQDRKTGSRREIYPQGMSAEQVMGLLADPAKQFDPVPPPKPPST